MRHSSITTSGSCGSAGVIPIRETNRITKPLEEQAGREGVYSWWPVDERGVKKTGVIAVAITPVPSSKHRYKWDFRVYPRGRWLALETRQQNRSMRPTRDTWSLARGR
jgi:hypothetical protein